DGPGPHSPRGCGPGRVSGARPLRLFMLPAMPRRARLLPGAVACALLVLATGCTAEAAVREPGSAITADEADTLARLLQRNHQRGGADFFVTAPYGPDVVLTLTGEVDFRRSH